MLFKDMRPIVLVCQAGTSRRFGRSMGQWDGIFKTRRVLGNLVGWENTKQSLTFLSCVYILGSVVTVSEIFIRC